MNELKELQEFRLAYYNAVIDQFKADHRRITCMRACEEWYRNELRRYRHETKTTHSRGIVDKGHPGAAE
jgi:hypothetical protein